MNNGLSLRDEIYLIRRAKRGNKRAANELISHHETLLRLCAISVRIKSATTIHTDDLIQIGRIIIVDRCIPKFDFEKRKRFAAYAQCIARRMMMREVYNHGRDVRSPVHTYEKINIINRENSELTLNQSRWLRIPISLSVMQEKRKEIVSEEPDSETLYAAKKTRQKIFKALSTLPQKIALMVYLKIMEECSVDDIARYLTSHYRLLADEKINNQTPLAEIIPMLSLADVPACSRQNIDQHIAKALKNLQKNSIIKELYNELWFK